VDVSSEIVLYEMNERSVCHGSSGSNQDDAEGKR
jgi:hypothetical protein